MKKVMRNEHQRSNQCRCNCTKLQRVSLEVACDVNTILTFLDTRGTINLGGTENVKMARREYPDP